MIGPTALRYPLLALVALLAAELTVGSWEPQQSGRGVGALAAQEQAARTNAGAVKSEAEELCSKGRAFWNKRTKEDLAKSLDYFRQALRKDPRYAPAYAGIADYYLALLGRRGISAGQALPAAKEAARKALELDENLAEGHASLGTIRFFYDWDWPGAEREFKRALQLDPKCSTAYQGYALLLSALGRHERAIAEVRRGKEADPDSAAAHMNAAYVYYNAGQYKEARQQAQKELELAPNLDLARYQLAWSYLRLGEREKAIGELEKLREIQRNDAGVLVALTYFYALAGNQVEASKTLTEFQEGRKRGLASPYYVAGMYLILEQKGPALAWLETSYTEREWQMVFLHIDPMWEGLRSDSHFQELLRRIGLPP